MAFDTLLQHRVSVYGQTNTADASGGTVQAWSITRATNVPCLIKGDGGGEVVQFGQRMIRVTHTIATASAVAQTGDKVVDADGASYLITSIRLQRGVGNIDTWYLWQAGELLPGDV